MNKVHSIYCSSIICR